MVNVTIENLAPCRKLVRVDVDAQQVDQTFEEVTSQLQKEVKIPGFRPGKAPKQMIVKNYSKLLEDEVKKKVLGDSYRKALSDHKIHPVGNPDVEEIQFGRGQNYQFAITVETAPEFELPEYKGLPVKRETGNVTEDDIERAIGILRDRHAAYNDVQRPVQNGDIAVVNYKGTSDGKPLIEIAPTAKGLTTQNNFWIEVKEGSFIPGFTEQLVGMNAADKKTVEVDFPADFVSQPLAGKHGVYEVELVQVKEKALPEINDEFAKKFGADNLVALRDGVRRDLEAELQNKISRGVREQLLNRLLERVNYELPESLLKEATSNTVYEMVYQSQQRGMTREQIEQQKDSIYNYASSTAQQRLKTSFLLGKIAEKENIQVTSEELYQRLSYIAYQRKMDGAKMVKEMQKTGEIRTVQEQALLAKVIDFLEKYAQIEDVPAGSLKESQPQAEAPKSEPEAAPAEGSQQPNA
ncbi:MAG: trigger factor [Verrucomicrobiales bacterium]